jgi:hypothetical protein
VAKTSSMSVKNSREGKRLVVLGLRRNHKLQHDQLASRSLMDICM